MHSASVKLKLLSVVIDHPGINFLTTVSVREAVTYIS